MALLVALINPSTLPSIMPAPAPTAPSPAVYAAIRPATSPMGFSLLSIPPAAPAALPTRDSFVALRISRRLFDSRTPCCRASLRMPLRTALVSRLPTPCFFSSSRTSLFALVVSLPSFLPRLSMASSCFLELSPLSRMFLAIVSNNSLFCLRCSLLSFLSSVLT